MRRQAWELILALVIGIAAGLIYAWVISPIRYVDTGPDTLRADFKERYRTAISVAYAATGNLERARARLALLGDPDPVQALSSQAQQMLAAGEPFETVRKIAQLASDLQSPGAVALVVTSSPTSAGPSGVNPGTPTPELTGQPETEVPGPSIQIVTPGGSPTPRPTRTPIPAPGAPFQLTSQDTVCSPDSPEGLLQIVLMDARRRQLAGMEIVVLWAGGEDHFFTGFKPELGNGYADYTMQDGVAYSVRIEQGGPPVSNITAPTCPAGDGGTFSGGIKLTFQQE